MCDVCCSRLRGWGRSFTRTETFLTLLEAFLLIVFIAFLTFVVLHFIACSKKEIDELSYPNEDDDGAYSTDEGRPVPPTVAPGVKCTWKPKEPTEAATRYYEQTGVSEVPDKNLSGAVDYATPTPPPVIIDASPKPNRSLVEEMLPYLTDGEDAGEYDRFVLALVKIRPPQDIMFGCILTIVADYWVVTAASCIEAIEEVDSLDSFVMMEEYGGGRTGATHAVADVFVHPWYQGANITYDLVALKSENSLVSGTKSVVEISSLLEYFLMPIGEKLVILGYGKYRGTDESSTGRGLLSVATYRLSGAACGPAHGAGGWSARHLRRPAAAAGGRCGARALCGGALSARGAPCRYCAGTPLLRATRLLGVMADNPQCAVTCDPALYVALPLLEPWLLALVDGDDFVQ